MAAPPIEICPNCSTSLLGSHCHECGQKKIEPNEYSLKLFIGRAINDFTDLESNKVLRTLSAIILRPGLLAAEYLAGRRGSYLSPLKLYLTFSALYPVALIYLIFALRRVYQQRWTMTVLKAVVLFACETLLFFAVNHRRVRDCIYGCVEGKGIKR